ncbi:MAG: bifunctional phosphoribosylaminoimidazolecarboxamide formyltransferase/IMP cyclohydrolase [Capsulimonadaceae bacterium]
MRRVERALLSVSDKTGLIDFARGLSDLGIEVISTGGTAAALAEAGIPITPISDVTHFPEMLEGRVKTLHPAVHGGILADRSKPEHMAAIAELGINPIDMVVVNLYPFARTVAKPGVTREDAIENIDIGGPSMVRSAAKNHASVAVVVSPDSYPAVLDELQTRDGVLSPETLRRLAGAAFAHTAAYDAGIARYFALADGADQAVFPDVLSVTFEKVHDLRYGENPHQKAAFYREPGVAEGTVATARKLHGKELSFNNIYDLNAAYNLVREFASDHDSAVAIIKHTNPCGLAVAATLADAFQRARAGDPISAFGGILATTRPIDVATAEMITGKNTFFEAIIAPGYDAGAFKILTEKKQWGANLILLECPLPAGDQIEGFDYKRVTGGLLVQTEDRKTVGRQDLTTVSRRGPTSQEMDDLLFAWRAVKHVKSNAIVIARDRQLIGVGAGQMNRVQSVRLAVEQAGEKARGAVLASDAFFPFADGPEAAGEAGIAAIIQPGGSKKDAESIEMADNYNMAMLLTGNRHFRH